MYRQRRVARRRGRGKVGDFFKKLWGTIKEKKLISKGLSAVAPYLGAYSPIATGASQVAGALGAGRRRRMYRGGALRLAGMGARKQHRLRKYF